MDVWNPNEGMYQRSLVPKHLSDLYEKAKEEMGAYSQIRLSRHAGKVRLEIETTIQ